jgi:hypothetical protein
MLLILQALEQYSRTRHKSKHIEYSGLELGMKLTSGLHTALSLYKGSQSK